MDHAFYVLVLMAVPVCVFVFAGVTYSMIRFRRRRGVTEDGPPVYSNNKVVAAWFAITTALILLVIIYRGTIGLLESRDHGHSQGTASASGNQQMVVEVEGSQWVWKITYSEQGAISYAELVVPRCCCSGLSSAGFG
ncbi:MAG TPA: hypothetical protein EYM65_12070 [Dehalococcoidia bacterium]|nr:hypothetical protein [Dehalococcoidia bacterium]